jgi:pyruvate,water dikinase
LINAGIRVPPGFAITTNAYKQFLEEGAIAARIEELLEGLDENDLKALDSASEQIRQLIEATPFPLELEDRIAEYYRRLSNHCCMPATPVAVRSSATAEDLPSASFAGQQESYLNVQGEARVLDKVRDCMASLFTDRAIVYRAERGFDQRAVALSVGVQKMVRSDLACAGVLFTLDTESGFPGVVLVTGAWGLGETVVQGRVDPDEFWVHKATARDGFASVLRRERGAKTLKLVYGRGGTHETREVRVPRHDRERFVLSDDEVLTLARWGMKIEDHYSKHHGRPTPMDVEWARDGRSGELFILQARPETVHSQAETPQLELHRLCERGEVLVRGKNVGQRIAAGPVHVIHGPDELSTFREGEVLVADMTDPDWEPVLRRAAAVVTDHGGRTCHAAIVSREIGIPCVVGTGDATRVLETGREVTVSCAESDEGRVYDGRLEFASEVIDPATLPEPPVPLMLNVANPEIAFQTALLPSAGVGLARMEFVVSNWIGVHPMALLHPERVGDAEVRRRVLARARDAESPGAFFVDRLASGIGLIAAAFHPRPVIVRLSDFKTNEYAGLLGGADFEPTESNPMIGFRGASRYYHERYREGFALECAALRRVRETFGLVNLKVMIPFCRTLEEARRVLDEMAKNGLVRGEDGLEVYVMCEIPSNVILAEEFAELFDGFSIGSNDLTQLALGVDRDSELLAPLFDERDPAVKRLIAMVVEGAHRRGRKVGICGQAPSDHPDFAEFLTGLGIDSISLTPDSLPGVARRLGGQRG